MQFFHRVSRHVRLAWGNRRGLRSPPFLILFLNSICNMRCEHCFYWRNLNHGNDLTFDEILGLSRSLGRIENLNLSGGEPFLRPEFSQICRQFVRRNQVREIYVPTNGYFTARTEKHIRETLAEPRLDLLAVELSLDGMRDFHDRFRDCPGAFDRAMQTYDVLATLQKHDSRLRIHANSTATNVNLGEIKRLTAYLFDQCPRIDHHNLAIIRGDRQNPSLLTPDLDAYGELYNYIRRLWAPRELGRYGASVEPLLQWVKLRTLAKRTQIVPCRAGVLSAVVYANGDVGVCELQSPLGNLREKSFPDIWNSDEAKTLRESVKKKECFCATEMFLWPSIVYQPKSLARAIVGARAWQRSSSLVPRETRAGSEVDHAKTTDRMTVAEPSDRWQAGKRP